MEGPNAPRSQVRNPKTLRIRDRRSPSTGVRQCPGAVDLTGEYPNSARNQTQEPLLADRKTYSDYFGNNLGNGGGLGVHRRKACPQDQTPQARTSTGEESTDAGSASP